MNMKKVLVIGGGGREHAIVDALSRSPQVGKIYCAPGNAGISAQAECVAIKDTDVEGLKNFALENAIDLAVVGPEVSLAAGVVDAFKNAGLRIFGPSKAAATIEASKDFAKQLMAKYNAAKTSTWTGNGVVISEDDGAYAAVQEASTLLDDGDEANGIQSFPFAERQILMRPTFRAELLNTKGVLLGGSNYAQSMLAKGAVSPEARKEWGNMYCGEIDGTPCYIVPSALWNRAGAWAGNVNAFSATQAIVCAASATDRGISTQDYIKIIDSPNGAGKRLQPKTRWGVNVCYPKGIIPILAEGTTVPSAEISVTAVGSRG